MCLSLSVSYQRNPNDGFQIGFGISLAHGAAPLLVTELAHMQHRARITSLYNTTWYLGSVSLSFSIHNS